MYPGLTHGAGKLVEEFGTEKQKALFLKNLFVDGLLPKTLFDY